VSPGILTLTTDFGSNGPYVAAMKGVVLTRAPGTQLVDVSHTIKPQDIAEGSFLLASVVDYFQKRSELTCFIGSTPLRPRLQGLAK